jgi:hypothetical protein
LKILTIKKLDFLHLFGLFQINSEAQIRPTHGRSRGSVLQGCFRQELTPESERSTEIAAQFIVRARFHGSRSVPAAQDCVLWNTKKILEM